MKKFYFYLIILLTQMVNAQSNLDKDQQLVYTYIYSKQFAKAKAAIDENFLKSDDISRKIIGYVYLADYYISNPEYSDESLRVEALETAKLLANNSNNPLDKAYVDLGYARYFNKLGKNDLFTSHLNNSIKIFRQHPNEDFILTQLYFLKFSNKIRSAIEGDTNSDAQAASKHAIKSKNNILIEFTYNNLAYYHIKQFDKTSKVLHKDSAEYYYQKAKLVSEKITDPEAYKIANIVHLLNYGSFKARDISYNTMPYNEKIIELAKDTPHLRGYKALAYNNIGSYYKNNGNFKVAQNYFEQSYALAKDDENIYYDIKAAILNNLSIVYEEQGNLNAALDIERQSKDLLKQATKKQFDDNTLALETYYNLEQKNQKILQLEEINQQHTVQKRMYIIIAFLALCTIIFMYFVLINKQKLNKQKTEILEAEKNETKLKLQLESEERNRLKAERELIAIQQEQLQQKALATTLQLQYKNSFIDDLKERIKDNTTINIDRIFKEDRINNDNFDEVKNIIQEIHPMFFNRLTSIAKHKLTNQDLKYAAYFYLKMDNQQIAQILKVETKTVRMAKYRLKQKLGLDKDVDLINYIQNINI